MRKPTTPVKNGGKQKLTLPPLQTMARHLESLLCGGGESSTRNSDDNGVKNNGGDMPLHSNPSKTVRRWLGTSSSTAKSTTLLEISQSAMVLLHPEGKCAIGRELLCNLSPPKAVNMEVEVNVRDVNKDNNQDHNTLTEGRHLIASQCEVETWLISVAVQILFKQSNHTEAAELAEMGVKIVEIHLDETNVSMSGSSPASGMYPILARLYRLARLCLRTLMTEDLRVEIVHAHRIACLRRDVDTQATLLNIMLRDFLIANHVDQAQKLLLNSSFPDSASNNQLCRYLYHSGRIQALRLEYTSAFSNLSQCLRKAPTNTGLGFRIAVQRLLVIVQLLMGEIPDRSVFFTQGMIGELAPYIKITQAVRRGDLAIFHSTVSQFALRFKEDGTHTLITRLAHSVVKAGLHRLNTSYSRISLLDVACRLGLANTASAEFVVAKAIRDGVIEAIIYHADDGREGYVHSCELVDVYATSEPSDAFHRRIAYCLTTHNDTVRGMRYPPDAYKKQLDASRGRWNKSDDKTDEEKAQELEEELEEDY